MEARTSARLIEKAFARHLRRSGYSGKQLAMYLPQILRNWVALQTWRELYEIDGLLPHEWVEIENVIVTTYRKRWQAAAAESRRKRKKYDEAKARQLTLDL
jgi:hypothetical protein